MNTTKQRFVRLQSFTDYLLMELSRRLGRKPGVILDRLIEREAIANGINPLAARSLAGASEAASEPLAGNGSHNDLPRRIWEFLWSHPSEAMTINEIATRLEITPDQKDYLRVTLGRMADRRLLVRVVPGTYVMPLGVASDSRLKFWPPPKDVVATLPAFHWARPPVSIEPVPTGPPIPPEAEPPAVACPPPPLPEPAPSPVPPLPIPEPEPVPPNEGGGR